MQDYSITLTDSPDPVDVEAVKQGLDSYDASQGAVVDWVPLALFARNAEGSIIAGLTGGTYWGYLYIGRLWTDDRFRNNGLGSRLLEEAEQEAQNRGCHSVHLMTGSFNALPFYRKRGYMIFGELPDMPIGYTQYFLCKKIKKDGVNMNDNNLTSVRAVLQKFQDGYTARDPDRLDEFMQLFMPDDGIEMIGIGASKRAENEWFEGLERVRDIVEGDWKYWGDVKLDVVGAKITVRGEAAWLSTTGTVTQTKAFDTAVQFHLDDMKAIFDKEGLSADEKLMEVTHYGMRRLRERAKGLGHSWPFTFTAVLVKDGGDWRFHTLHWAMPVD